MTMPSLGRRTAQQADVSWERVGAPLGGAVVALAASPDFARDGSCFAATMAGLYRSHDAGRSWRRVGTGVNGLSKRR